MMCKHVCYSGRVQGVGFRYTACSVARGFQVAGFVRNLPNGDVELVAEGEQQAVDAFLAALSRRMAEYIHAESSSVGEVQGLMGFTIR